MVTPGRQAGACRRRFLRMGAARPASRQANCTALGSHSKGPPTACFQKTKHGGSSEGFLAMVDQQATSNG